MSAGFVALAVALWGLRELIAGTRLRRFGIRLALVGVGFRRAGALTRVWVALGVAVLRTQHRRPEVAPVPA